MRLGTFLAFIVFLFVVFQVNPMTSGVIGQVSFYGVQQLLGHLGVSFRQGVFLAILAEILLILQSYRILTWWDALLVVVGMFLVELYFLAKPESAR